MADLTPHPYRVLLALEGQCETLELTELGRGAAVVRCQRLGEW